MSETRTLTIEAVESKNGFFVVTASGKKYGCKEDITQLIGKTGQAEVNMKQNGKYQNWYLNKFTPNEDSTPHAPAATSKEDYFVLSYAKDLAVSAINAAQLPCGSAEEVAKYVLAIYHKLNEGISEG